nr:methyltransferase domain-containing protein [Frankia sp. QA3]
MRAQRPSGLAPAVNAAAQDLPFDDNSFDAAMALVTVHQWSDVQRGLRELRRVSRGPVVVLTFDGDATQVRGLAGPTPFRSARGVLRRHRTDRGAVIMIHRPASRIKDRASPTINTT